MSTMSAPIPPSLESLASMHASTISTLSDLFALALTHPGQAEAQGELQAAKTKVAELEGEIRELRLRAAKVEPQFVTVLIDGDGAIFHGDFLKQGSTGGHAAAKLLLSSLPAFIASTGPPELAPHAARLAKNAVINVIVNKFGLAGAVVKAGIVSSFSTVADFFLAFSQAHSNINVIDSGPGKEASDSKIHAQLHFYTSLPSCGLTILAGSHDAGYANVLRSLVTEGRDVVLLRGGHTAWLLEGIVNAGEIEGLFAQGKIGSLVGVGGAVGTGMPSPAPLGSAARPVISNGKATAEARLKEEESAREKKKMRRRLKRQEERERKESAALEASDSETEDEGADDAWADTDGSTVDDTDALVRQFAGVGIRSGETPSRTRMTDNAETPVRHADESARTMKAFKTPLREKPMPQSWETLVATPGKGKVKGTPKATPARTPGGVGGGAGDDSVPVQGGDRALRYLTPRPCHKHYLAKEGCDNKNCAFGHHWRLNPGQLHYLKKLAKESPCPWLKLGRCSYDDESCIYGHVCPHASNCLYGASCRFNELPDGGHGGVGEAARVM